MNRFRSLTAATLLAIASPFIAPPADAAADLPAMQADPARTSVSGLSSGAFMTVQYGVAFSSSVVGLGVVAGGPYNCAIANAGPFPFAINVGILTCMSGTPSASLSWMAAKSLDSLGQIDPVAGLAKLKVYVFGGTQDQVVHPPVVAATRDFFQAASVGPKNLRYVDKLPAGHAFIAPAFGNDCGTTAPPYIDRCQVKIRGQSQAYDQPKEILQHIYGPLKPPATTLSATVRPFDQTAFAASSASMDSAGFVYVPKDCAANATSCAVHIVFHGCKQGAQRVGSDVYASVGYNRWADTNRLIVLYPQAVTSESFPSNPEGCWDWFGYTGPVFQTRSGLQLSAIKSMVDRLTGQK